MNLLFQDPPWVRLGSPAGLALFELNEEVLRGRRLFSFQGDIPGWFYRLRWGSELAGYFAVENVTPWELRQYAGSHGILLKKPEADDVGVGASSLVAGAARAVVVGRACLESSFETLRAPWATRGQPVPSFGASENMADQLILLQCIDDYIGFTREGPSGEEGLIIDKDGDRDMLNQKGRTGARGSPVGRG